MKTALALAAGFVFIVALSIGLDILVVKLGFFPERSADYTAAHWSIATAYRAIIEIAGCYLAARLAPSRPMMHALILGGIGTVLSVLGIFVAAKGGPEFGPIWYPVAVALTAMPCAWIGGKLASR